MPFIADLHIHSKYSRATAKDMDLAALAKWAKIKGIGMLGTGDFTHPVWFSELKSKLQKADSPGVYRYDNIDFILSVEVSNIYFKAGRTRKVHNIIFAPSFEAAEEVSSALSEYGELSSDGRPMLSVECDKMVRLLTRIDPGIFLIPGHVWTPHFSIFGSNSGFDSPEECFEDQTGKIFSIETGLSSDPGMNWRWSKLDRFCLTSHSDAHSPSKIGREANVFKERIGYKDLVEILKNKDRERFLYTIEFFPEEGKYHWDGHRNCKTRLSPQEALRVNNICPVCGKKVTIGVMHRLEGLADRSEGYVDKTSPSFKRVVPLAEVIGEAFDVGADSMKVEREYARLIKNFGTEFHILLEMDAGELKENFPERIAQGILNVRNGNIEIMPGYDGEYGKVKIFKEGEAAQDKQLSFF
ncbi:MAG: endonuclease Q family protein [Candidatus Omnitrophica bacterium]|nr:endonuclease Q family protein [Candidatus Omnitrophota bacterium]MDD5436563.1 endonuclease Q family protein [Candidatus Omnitrophota bacterium]